MDWIWHPDCGQITGAVKEGELLGIAAVVLDPVSWLFGDEAWRGHNTAVPEPGQLPVDAIAAAAGFVAEFEPASILAEPLCDLCNISRCVWKGSDEADLSISPFPGGGEFARALVAAGFRNPEIESVTQDYALDVAALDEPGTLFGMSPDWTSLSDADKAAVIGEVPQMAGDRAVLPIPSTALIAVAKR